MSTTRPGLLTGKAAPANGAIRQDEINAILWKACDTFRGTIDPSEYKNYILVMLFLKYISDLWADRYAQLRAEHGDDDRRIRRQLKYERFVLPEGADYYRLYDRRGEANIYAFISHMIETTYLEPSQRGRVGVIVPHGVLFRGGAEGRIRRQLIEENLLDAVIGLPENLFYGTGIPAAILLFRRDRADDRVLFIDASAGYEQGANQNRLRDEDRATILAAYRRRESVAKYASLAPRAEIAANDYNLNIPRYVDTFEEEPPVDLPALNAEIAALRARLAGLDGQMQAYLRELGLA